MIVKQLVLWGLLITHIINLFLIIFGIGLLELPEKTEQLTIIFFILTASVLAGFGLTCMDRLWKVKPNKILNYMRE